MEEGKCDCPSRESLRFRTPPGGYGKSENGRRGERKKEDFKKITIITLN
jgi:hypothetical protein